MKRLEITDRITDRISPLKYLRIKTYLFNRVSHREESSPLKSQFEEWVNSVQRTRTTWKSQGRSLWRGPGGGYPGGGGSSFRGSRGGHPSPGRRPHLGCSKGQLRLRHYLLHDSGNLVRNLLTAPVCSHSRPCSLQSLPRVGVGLRPYQGSLSGRLGHLSKN